MLYLEGYMDFFKSGSFNKTYELDDDWVLKMPFKVGEGDHDFTNMKEVLNKFDNHIWTLREYPEIFPKVKKLDKYRVAVEKLDVEESKRQIEHIYNYMYNYIPSTRYRDFLTYIITEEGTKYLNILEEGDEICQNWFYFIKKLRNTQLFKESGYLDTYDDNFGIDKNGDIKLLDF